MIPSFNAANSTFTFEAPAAAEWGSQIFDPTTETYLFEGPRTEVTCAGQVTIPVLIPPEASQYRLYISRIDKPETWAYTRNQPFYLLDVTVAEEVHQDQLLTTTLSRLRRQRAARNLRLALTLPWRIIAEHHRLMHSLVRRDILGRYRGSFGGWFWTVLNPLLLMLTYFFVFGLVLKARFGSDPSPAGFALFFLAGMLPWLAISEALGRAPINMLEHRTFIKKLRFPVEILPLNLTLAGLINEVFGLGIFLLGLLLARHSIPLTVLWLPVLLVPQLLFTAGLCWFLAALGVFLRDLAQVNGFLLTIWFFLTPICYPETAMPPEAKWLLTKNPVYVLVEGYRRIFLQSSAPEWHSLWRLWVVSIIIFLAGHAFFRKLRKQFADTV